MSDLLNINRFLHSEGDEKLLDILLYGNRRFNTKLNFLMFTLKFIKDSHIFNNSYF